MALALSEKSLKGAVEREPLRAMGGARQDARVRS